MASTLSAAVPAAEAAAVGASTSAPRPDFCSERYTVARTHWPASGRVVLAQFDEEAVLVYSAFPLDIVRWGVQHQSLAGAERETCWNPQRTSWIKTNFLWMQYRSGWNTKKNQEGTLGFWIKRSLFEEILAASYGAQNYSRCEDDDSYRKRKAKLKKGGGSRVVLQWDPDHAPNGAKHPKRRAIQLGLRGSWMHRVYENMRGELLKIVDLTDFVREQAVQLETSGSELLLVARERVMRLSHRLSDHVGADIAHMAGAQKHAPEMDPNQVHRGLASGAESKGCTAVPAGLELIDIGINICNRQFKKGRSQLFQRARDSGVVAVLLTGTSVAVSRQSLSFAETQPAGTVFCTAGVHPHDAKHFDGSTVVNLRKILAHRLCVAVGECGLDFNRNFSTAEEQTKAFAAQVDLACELAMPLFVHSREAHAQLLEVMDAAAERNGQLPPVVVHCFTETLAEAQDYLDRGFYIGFTGTVCKHQRGQHLRRLLPSIPLDRVMLETDAPFMGFRKGRRWSEPADVVGVAETVADVLGLTLEEVASVTTANARAFFRLPPREREAGADDPDTSS